MIAIIILILIVLVMMMNITGIIIFIIIILVIRWLWKWLWGNIDDSSSSKNDNKGSKNCRQSSSEFRLLQIGKYDDKYLQQTNRETHFHPLNNLQRRVVNNKIHLHLSRGANTKCNTVNTSKPRTTKFVTNDNERQRCFVSRKEALLKMAEEIKTATRCDIYVEIRNEEKPHLYKSETFLNYSLEPEEMDVAPSNKSRRRKNKRRIESDDDSNTEDNGLSPLKKPKTVKATKVGRMQDQNKSEIEIETDQETEEICCNICENSEDDNDNKGPWVICDYPYEDLSCCLYTAHLSCLDLHEYPESFLCPEHI